jgi:outer membrane protein assembly factor BamB
VTCKTGNVAWTQTLSGDTFSVPPIVITDTLSGDLLLGGTSSGKLYVVTAHTGANLQKLNLGAPIEGGMAFSGGLLVVPSGNSVVGL